MAAGARPPPTVGRRKARRQRGFLLAQATRAPLLKQRVFERQLIRMHRHTRGLLENPRQMPWTDIRNLRQTRHIVVRARVGSNRILYPMHRHLHVRATDQPR